MSGATLDAAPRPGALLQRGLSLVPGLLLLLAIGCAGKLTGQGIAAWGRAHPVALPNVEYVLWAILYGLVLTNLVGLPRIFRPGVATYGFWLKPGIVLLGVRRHSPKFVLGFLAVSLLATLGAFGKQQTADLAALSRWAFLPTFAGVGLSTDPRKLQAPGGRPLAVAVAGMAGIAIATFALVVLAERAGWL